ncbi:sigma-70 family RNA polymerase sigma factor [Amycolatopsis roodepoortensis]|uniref:RNA polymerase sigma-70 factor (ECF subfamily) n=1 Tax=Amycolatopsis roodepoortensis TaxID=700274 RepID=A0ABR9LAE1_9PSEU|nr:sigma-70 family RNA polymerase sigma factor [Amycolatopsis roodepoortensis]MBE1577500.1 RNA polymerase sigma-70 factor (ECF subfamily) [Amycolatopsis roodepoortensis]
MGTRLTWTAPGDLTSPGAAPPPDDGALTADLESLVPRARRGDPAATTELMNIVQPVVADYCRSRMDATDADDVAQETCLAVLTALPAAHTTGGSFITAVLRIAARKVAAAFRRRARDRSEPTPDPPDHATPEPNEPEWQALAADGHDRLTRLMSSLPDIQQEILRLRITVGMTAPEAGAVLRVSPGLVRVAQHRALHKLRTLISEDDL